MEELWFLAIAATICVAALVHATLLRGRNNSPPGPLRFPVIGNLIWLWKPLSDIEDVLRRLRARYGDLITLKIGPSSLIIVASHSLAHRALVQNGAVFSDRPAPSPTIKIISRSQMRISSAPYGPTWRLLRRNLTQEIFHPARVKAFSNSRKWVLSLLISRLGAAVEAASPVKLIDHFQFAMFSLLVLMCFGDRLSEDQIKEIQNVQRRLILAFSRSDNRTIFPALTRILFPETYKKLLQIRDDQERVLIPLIRARIHGKKSTNPDKIVAYIDTLADLDLPGENRKLEEGEMLSLCSEFLNAGTDTTSTALQWIMANLVKYPQIQEKLYQEIIEIACPAPPIAAGNELRKSVDEGILEKLPYLKAVVLEALRLHPPGHFVLPHKVKDDVELDGYTIPKNAVVNFLVAEMGRDAVVWESAREFRPERFVGAEVDVTGSREVKMMPFGTGRRICPGMGLALLHLEYFVANLVWYYKWSPVEGDEVDLSEKHEFTTVMKFPLQARISPRI